MTRPRAALDAGTFCTRLFPKQNLTRRVGLAALPGARCADIPNALTGKGLLPAKQFVQNHAQAVYIGRYRKTLARHLLRARVGE